ncbi:gluconate 2-dehydrogenase subunit 3 family protein [Inmirania thermothiophila]|uniref:Gluconate 2-dehydrogenase subunit 3-like protein n=1 Tax=Inmirania thermothiophila TaxID=1750597 RepID=A0A3N1XX43_9GAMM|nr:gluconate 2-dehydrogenase subunit 3 family protein [Inmirania thermothiophila]ROR29507.1 gluconate 2-dehydrogenase subunit 3-like protein [Inmirania thermothiophila]
MRWTRRGLLRLAAAGLSGLAGAAVGLRLWRARPLRGAERGVLDAAVDAVVPADEAPGALDLGIAAALAAEAEGDPRLRRLLREGVRWLEREARSVHGRGYAALGEEARTALLLAAAGRSGPPRRFFETLRREVLVRYYGDPGVWAAIGYRGPPQPRGYPRYWAPPDDA